MKETRVDSEAFASIWPKAPRDVPERLLAGIKLLKRVVWVLLPTIAGSLIASVFSVPDTQPRVIILLTFIPITALMPAGPRTDTALRQW